MELIDRKHLIFGISLILNGRKKMENKIKEKKKGPGNPGTPRVVERRERATLIVLPSVLAPFKKRHGRGWAREVEKFMKKDLKIK